MFLPRTLFSRIAVGVVAVLSLGLLLASFYTNEQYERAVVTRFGKVVAVTGPGLHLKLPIVNGAAKISVRNQVLTWNEMQTYSRDQQPATIKISVNYQVVESEIESLYATYGANPQSFVDRLIHPKVVEQFKNVFGHFEARAAIQDRARLNLEAFEAISKAIDGPVRITGVQIENIDFSKAYEQSIERRMLAEVAVDERSQNAKLEKVQADIILTQATGAANAVRAGAQAAADAIRLRGDADADAIRAKGNADAEAYRAKAAVLRENPNLIGLTIAETWKGVLPTTMLPGSSVPMITLPGK